MNYKGMRQTEKLRELLRNPGLVAGAGAHDALSARIVQQAGFPLCFMTGAGVSMVHGYADVGLMSVEEVVSASRYIAEAVDIPVVADADNGYGNAINAMRTVRMFEQAGIAGIHIEDQVWPKRCGHLAGKQVISTDEMARKIRAAVEARRDPDLLIIARTDALALSGFDDALRRAETYAEAGADVLFVEAPTTVAEIEAIPKALNRPCIFNYATGGGSPLLPLSRLRALRYGIILLPVQALFAAAQAMADYLQALKTTDEPATLDDRLIQFSEFNDLIGVTEFLALTDRYESNP